MIPNNIEECFETLKKDLKPEDIAFIKSSDDNVVSLHHSLGRYLRNNWGFWSEEGSELKSYFQRLGLFHPDDMSSIILHSFHNHLNGKPLDVDGQIKFFQDFWNRTNIVEEGK